MVIITGSGVSQVAACAINSGAGTWREKIQIRAIITRRIALIGGSAHAYRDNAAQFRWETKRAGPLVARRGKNRHSQPIAPMIHGPVERAAKSCVRFPFPTDVDYVRPSPPTRLGDAVRCYATSSSVIHRARNSYWVTKGISFKVDVSL